jgi:hypothetical protein
MFPQGVDTGFLGFHELAMGFKAAKEAASAHKHHRKCECGSFS